MNKILVVVVAGIALAASVFGQTSGAQSAANSTVNATASINTIEYPYITSDVMLVHVLTHGYNSFEQDGWTVKFTTLLRGGDINLWIDEYEGIATKGSWTVHYFLRETYGSPNNKPWGEHTIGVRIPVDDLVAPSKSAR